MTPVNPKFTYVELERVAGKNSEGINYLIKKPEQCYMNDGKVRSAVLGILETINGVRGIQLELNASETSEYFKQGAMTFTFMASHKSITPRGDLMNIIDAVFFAFAEENKLDYQRDLVVAKKDYNPDRIVITFTNPNSQD
jgi:hypothetical protein